MKTIQNTLIFLLLGIGLILNSSCDKVKPSGYTVTETRDVASFDKIECIDIHVNISQGNTQNISITADANLMKKIETSVSNGKLLIRTKKNTLYLDVPDPVVTINCPNIKSLKTNNSGGTTTLNVINNSQLDIENINDGNIEIIGLAENLNITTKGQGHIYGYKLTAKNCTVEHDGTKDIRIKVTDYLSGSVKNNGNLAYKGNPSLNVKVTGSGKIIDAN